MKIGFWFDYDQTYTFTYVFNELIKLNPNLAATGFVINDRYYDFASKNLHKKSNLVSFYNLLNQAKRHDPSNNAIKRFNHYDEKYGLTKVMYSDRWLKKLNSKLGFEGIINVFANLIEYFEEYIKQEKLDAFVFNCVASAWSHLFYYVLKEHEIKVMIPTATGIDNRFFIADNPYEYIKEAYEYFKRLNLGLVEAEDIIREEAKKVIKKIRNFTPAYENKAIDLEKEKFKFPSIKKAFSYLNNYIRFYKNDYTQSSPLERAVNLVVYRINKFLNNRMYKKISEIDKSFVYYPLHYEPEIANLILSQYHQHSIIDIIVKQIPMNWLLVLKEHPAMVNQRNYKFFKEILERYPNVIVINPSENSLELVKKSELVFSLCGTVILESIILKKPVVYTGKSKYEGFGLGICSKDILNFENLIKEAKIIKYNEHEIENMIISIIKFSYDFIFAEPLGRPEVLNPENISKIARALYDKL